MAENNAKANGETIELTGAVDGVKEHTEKKTFEDVLERAGGFGRFQILLYILINLFENTAGYLLYSYVFDGYNPGWTCSSQNETIDREAGACYAGNNSFCVESIEYKPIYVSIITEWNLICNRTFVKQLMVSLFFFGTAFGAMAFGRLSDLHGRKKMAMICAGVMIVTQCLIRLSTYVYVYGVLRVIAGVAMGAVLANTKAWVIEFMPPKGRPLAGVVFGPDLGMMTLAILAYALRDWKLVTMTTGLMSIPIYIAVLWFIPESARWHLSVNNLPEAAKILVYVAKMNGHKITEADLESDLQLVRMEIERQSGTKVSYSTIDMFRPLKMAIRSTVLSLLWLGTFFAFHGINASMNDLSGDLFTNVAIVAGIRLATRWSTVFILNKIGRRFGVLLYIGVPGLFLVAIMIMEAVGFLDKGDNRMFVTYFAVIASVLLACGLSTCYCYTLELYPTSIRNLAVGLAGMGGRIGAILSPQIVLLNTFFSAASYMVFGTVCLAGAILSFIILPETNNRPLSEETAKDDSPKAASPEEAKPLNEEKV